MHREAKMHVIEAAAFDIPHPGNVGTNSHVIFDTVQRRSVQKRTGSFYAVIVDFLAQSRTNSKDNNPVQNVDKPHSLGYRLFQVFVEAARIY